MELPASVVEFEDTLDRIFQELEEAPTLTSGVGVLGPGAAYALVWEFGNIRQHKQGPKTVLGVNPVTGERVWMSIQAPWGYVRSNESEMWTVINQEIEKAKLGNTRQEVWREMNEVSTRIAVECQKIIRKAAPIDTGELRADIQEILPGDMPAWEADAQDQDTILEMMGGME